MGHHFKVHAGLAAPPQADSTSYLPLETEQVAHEASPECRDVVEGIVDHLLHISYDESTVLRLAVTADGAESVTALGNPDALYTTLIRSQIDRTRRRQCAERS